MSDLNSAYQKYVRTRDLTSSELEQVSKLIQ